MFQSDEQRQYRDLHKYYFEGCFNNFGDLEAPKVKIVEEFFYDVFTNYNVQMWGILASEKLVDSTENAMNKMAIDIVHRITEYMKKAATAKAKDKTKMGGRGTGSFLREDLVKGLEVGQSDYSGSTWQRLRGIFKGRTIKLYGGKEFKSKNLLEEPAEIATDGDVDRYLEDSTSFKKYHYCYAFFNKNLSDIKQNQLAGKLQEARISDMYFELKKEKEKIFEEKLLIDF